MSHKISEMSQTFYGKMRQIVSFKSHLLNGHHLASKEYQKCKWQQTVKFELKRGKICRNQTQKK